LTHDHLKLSSGRAALAPAAPGIVALRISGGASAKGRAAAVQDNEATVNSPSGGRLSQTADVRRDAAPPSL